MTKKILVAAIGMLVLIALVAFSPAAPVTATQSQAKSVAIQVAASDAAHLVKSSKPKPTPRATAAQRASRALHARLFPKLHKAKPARSKAYAKFYIRHRYHWKTQQYQCLVKLWEKESGWTYNSYDPGQGSAMAGGVRKTWGIPQANPGTKMRSEGADWRTNTATQIRWGAKYIKSVYGTPCGAWGYWQDHRWY